MEKYFEIGQIVNTSGLKGVIKVKPFTDDITKFNTLKHIYIQLKRASNSSRYFWSKESRIMMIKFSFEE